MTRVSAAEADLLTVARAVVGRAEPLEAEPLLRSPRPAPPELGPAASRLLKETLAKGAVLALVHRGGARWARSLGPAGPKAGRLWERHPPPALHFGAASRALLDWLTASAVGGDGAAPLTLAAEPTAADELLLYLACDLLARTGYGQAAAAQPAFRRSALCCLGYADLLGRARALEPLPGFRFDGPWPVILEALQPELARRWEAAERAKGDIFHPSEMENVGASQEQVLSRFTADAALAGRRDLCTFLADAAAGLFSRPFAAAALFQQLDPKAPLGARASARRAAGAFLRGVLRLRGWDQEQRTVRFFDEGYEAAKLLVSEWGRLGEAGFQRAAAALRELESLAPSGEAA